MELYKLQESNANHVLQAARQLTHAAQPTIQGSVHNNSQLAAPSWQHPIQRISRDGNDDVVL